MIACAKLVFRRLPGVGMAYLPDFAERSLVFVGRAGVVLHNDVKALCFLSVRTSVRKKTYGLTGLIPPPRPLRE